MDFKRLVLESFLFHGLFCSAFCKEFIEESAYLDVSRISSKYNLLLMIQPSVFVSVFFFSLRCIHLVFSSSSFSLIQSKPQTSVLFWRTTIAFSLYLGTKRLASSLPVNPLKNSGAFVSGIETEGTSLEFLMDASISQLDRTTTTLLSRHVS